MADGFLDELETEAAFIELVALIERMQEMNQQSHDDE